MCALELFFSVDPSLGRVDYSLFSDQTLMEMFIDGFDDETNQRYIDNDGMYLDVCKWSCITCDDDGRVFVILLDNENICGSLELCYVPPKVKVVSITSNKNQLTGSIDLHIFRMGWNRSISVAINLRGK